jgi:6-phosphogluconolactonase
VKRTISGLLVILAGIGVMSPVRSFAQRSDRVGAVFVMTNAADRNEIIAYARDESGALSGGKRYDTRGRGSGGTTAPLGSQGALTLRQDHSLLFAVNTGSGDVSLFRVRNATLRLQDIISANGSSPVAVAQQGSLIYVLDAGGQVSVTGYRLRADGKLQSIANSKAFLTVFAGGSQAASLSISPNGQFLLVTERLPNQMMPSRSTRMDRWERK